MCKELLHVNRKSTTYWENGQDTSTNYLQKKTSKWPINIYCVLSHFNSVQHFATLWTGAVWAPLSMGFSRQEYWSGLLCPPPGDLPDPGIEPASLCLLHWQEGSLLLTQPRKPRYLLGKGRLKLWNITTQIPEWLEVKKIHNTKY